MRPAMGHSLTNKAMKHSPKIRGLDALGLCLYAAAPHQVSRQGAGSQASSQAK